MRYAARSRLWEPTPEQVAAEEWRPAPEFPGYEVSSLGRVRSLIFRNGYVERVRSEPLVMRLTRLRGYPAIMLCQERKQRLVYVHKLVAGAFIGPRPEGLQVAHLDGNPNHNEPGNLAYVLPRENKAHQVGHGTATRGSRNGNALLSEDAVLEMRRAYRAGEASIRSLCARFGMSYPTVRGVVRGERWRHVEVAA